MARRFEFWRTADGKDFPTEAEAAKHEHAYLRRDALQEITTDIAVTESLLANRDLALELVGILVHVHTFANSEISEEIQTAKTRIA